LIAIAVYNSALFLILKQVTFPELHIHISIQMSLYLKSTSKNDYIDIMDFTIES